MRADSKKLKLATKEDLIKELSLIDEELADEMHPASWARCKELYEYKEDIQLELRTR